MKGYALKSSGKKDRSFDIINEIVQSIKKSNQKIENGDVIVLSSKYLAISQGRTTQINKIIPSKEALKLSSKYKTGSSLSEIIIRESDHLLGGVNGFLLTSSNGLLVPNGGIDKSNIPKGNVVLYPDQASKWCDIIRWKIFLEFGKRIGIVVSDSRLMPSRMGTTSIALSCSGFYPVKDNRSKKDSFGNPLKVTTQAIADSISSVANIEMGEGKERTPFVILRGAPIDLTDELIDGKDTTVPYDQCVYVRSLRNYDN